MAKSMSSRQRVLTTLAHREPDRVPVDYDANPEIDHRLARHFGLALDVRDTLETMKPGGYILAPTHALQSNSPTENVVAMYRAAARYGTY